MAVLLVGFTSNFARAVSPERIACLRKDVEWRLKNAYERPWSVDGNLGKNGYNSDFSPLLEGRTIEQWAKDRHAAGQTANVVDLFGSAIFSQTPKVFDSLTGVRLAALVPKDVPDSYHGLPSWKEIGGNIHGKNTWRKLDRSLKERKIEAVDLITIRPVGPIDETSYIVNEGNSDQKAAYFKDTFAILNRAWSRLSPNDGTMLVQVSSLIDSRDFLRWVKRAQRTGIDIHVSKPNMYAGYMILKKTRSGQTLPNISLDTDTSALTLTP